MVADCTRWEDEVLSSLPSVVPVAVDEAGVNLIDVQVSLDGVPLVNAPAGQAIESGRQAPRTGWRSCAAQTCRLTGRCTSRFVWP